MGDLVKALKARASYSGACSLCLLSHHERELLQQQLLVGACGAQAVAAACMDHSQNKIQARAPGSARHD